MCVCVRGISAFCPLASITVILFTHHFCCTIPHTHTHRFSFIGSRSIILFRLINNFLQLKSGLETCLSLHAIHSPRSHCTDLSLSSSLSLPAIPHYPPLHWSPLWLCTPPPQSTPSSSTTISIRLSSALLVNQENSQQQRRGLGWSRRSGNASKPHCLERIRQGLGAVSQRCHAINSVWHKIYI